MVKEAVPAVQVPAVVYETFVPPIAVGRMAPTVAEQISAPRVVRTEFALESQHMTSAGWRLATVDLNCAELAFVRAPLSDTSTMEARIPMIAMTIRSSMRVKPFLYFAIMFSYELRTAASESGTVRYRPIADLVTDRNPTPYVGNGLNPDPTSSDMGFRTVAYAKFPTTLYIGSSIPTTKIATPMPSMTIRNGSSRVVRFRVMLSTSCV